MKKALLFTGLIAVLGMTMIVQAQTSPTAAVESTEMTTSNVKHPGHRACMNIASACEAAGYRLGKNMPGKNIWKDCVNPILAGQTIAGVNADSADIQACNARKAEWKSKHKNQMPNDMNNGMTATPQTTTTNQ